MGTVLSRDRLVVLAALAAVVALAWAYLAYIVLAQPAMDMDATAMAAMAPLDWDARYFAATLAMWLAMMIGMMLPSAVPTVLLFDALQRQSDAAHRADRLSTPLFVAGYVLAWSAFSLGATAAQWALTRASLLSAMMMSNTLVFAGLLLVAAGAYQFMPLKMACLRQCRSPAEFLVRHRRSGTLGSLRMGVRHGVDCIGCCWALMALLFAFGVMNLLWVATLAVFVFIEKLTPPGALLGRLGGVLMFCSGLVLVAIG